MTPYVAPRNPGLSVLLSFLWAGLGQIYNGQPLIGVPLAATVGFVGFLDYRILQKVDWVGWSSAPSEVQFFFQASLGVLAVIWLWSMWYAHRVATRINAGVSVSASPPAARATVTTSPSASVGTTGDPGEDTWRLIETSRNQALLEEFIAKFPDHPRAMMARILLERMKAEGTVTSGTPTSEERPPSAAVASPAPTTTPSFPVAGLVVGVLACAAALVVALDQFGIVYFPGMFRSMSTREAPATIVEPPTSTPPRHEARPLPPREEPPSEGVVIEATPIQPPPRPSEPEPLILPSETMRLELSAYPSVIRGYSSQLTTITWKSVNAEACALEGPAGYKNNALSGSVTGSSEQIVDLRFQFTCWKGDEEDYKVVIVRVTP